MLTDVYTTPGGCDEAIRIFLARDLSEAEGQRFEVEDEEADMEHARVSVDDLVRGVLAGELHNNCLAVGVLSLVAARHGDGIDALRPAEAHRGPRVPSSPEATRVPNPHPASTSPTPHPFRRSTRLPV